MLQTCGRLPTLLFAAALVVSAAACGDIEVPAGESGVDTSDPADTSDTSGAVDDDTAQEDAACIPTTCDAEGANCGVVDDGCGGTMSCGLCSPLNECGGGGTPNVCGCTPDCEGKSCGGDGCGGKCGTCESPTPHCSAGQCTVDECVPDCEGRECGPDGCGDICGSCSGNDACADGVCECQPQCEGKSCGDDGCGGTCGECTGDELVCQAGQCQDTPCEPDCTDKSCGDDGCGGSCGTCTGAHEICYDGSCACKPDCGGLVCGPDGCGGDCGICDEGEVCDGGQCECAPDCDGNACGPDGCGGECGACGSGEICTGGQCEPETTVTGCDGYCGSQSPAGCSCDEACFEAGDCCEDVCEVCGDLAGCTTCEPQCDGKECGDDGCGGTCGACKPDYVCGPEFTCEYWLDPWIGKYTGTANGFVLKEQVCAGEFQLEVNPSTAPVIEGEGFCEGKTGTVEFHIVESDLVEPGQFEGVILSKDPKGEEAKMTFQGQFDGKPPEEGFVNVTVEGPDGKSGLWFDLSGAWGK
ncbi:MAG: hypothetical protein ACQEXJ_13055 [Myxococcota bacterium]